MDDKFVVTGGEYSKKKVAEFTEAGAVSYMRNLITGRYWHACSKFVNDDGDTVSLLWSRVETENGKSICTVSSNDFHKIWVKLG